jgi:hypothetical protein
MDDNEKQKDVNTPDVNTGEAKTEGLGKSSSNNIYENIIFMRDFAQKSFNQTVLTIKNTKNSYDHAKQLVWSTYTAFDSRKHAEETLNTCIHRPLFNISSEINDKAPYLSSMIRNHYYLIMGSSVAALWFPMSRKLLPYIFMCPIYPLILHILPWYYSRWEKSRFVGNSSRLWIDHGESRDGKL